MWFWVLCETNEIFAQSAQTSSHLHSGLEKNQNNVVDLLVNLTEDVLLQSVRVCGCPRVCLRHRLTHQTPQANTTQLLHCKRGLCVCVCVCARHSLSFLQLLWIKYPTVEALPPSSPSYKSWAELQKICSELHRSVNSTWRDAVFVCVCVFVGSHGRPRPGGGWAAGMPLAKTSVPVRPVTTPKRHWPFVRRLTLSQRNKWCNWSLMTWKLLTGNTTQHNSAMRQYSIEIQR